MIKNILGTIGVFALVGGILYFAPIIKEFAGQIQINQQAVETPVDNVPEMTLVENQSYSCKSIRVIEGHIFDVYLQNDKRYLIALQGVVGTPPEAKERVVQLFNDSRREKHSLNVVPREWDYTNSRWIVDIYYNNSLTTLTDWLIANGLVYSR